MVPIVSKKSASMREKTSRMMETTPSLPKPPKRSTLPSVSKTGTAIGEPLSSGTVWPQPVGLRVGDPIDVRERLDDDGKDRGGDDRDQHRALHATHVEDDHEEKTEYEDQGRPAVKRTRNTELDGRRARADDARVHQADEGDEEAQAHRDRGLEGGGNRTEDGLAEAREDQQEDEDPLPRDNTHASPSAQARTEDQGEGDHRVQAEAGASASG